MGLKETVTQDISRMKSFG